MATLWRREAKMDPFVEAFCAGNDPVLDLDLVPYDVAASAAHARMLGKIGVLAPRETARLVAALKEIARLHAAGRFRIRRDEEDGHTAIEHFLARRLGPLGKKIHAGRSRNDQVLTALRLWERDGLRASAAASAALARAFADFARRHPAVPMPGYTHTRRAMPSSVAHWAAAHAEAAADGAELLLSTAAFINRSPLGSAAGYGVPLPLDRAFTARQLGFHGLLVNTLYAQNTRGKFEALVAGAAAAVMTDLARAAADIILYSSEEFGFLRLPPSLTTGSSIMPQKRNPDPLELVRARSAVVAGQEFILRQVAAGCPSGYHRDLQLTKEPVMRALRETRDSLEVMRRVVAGLKADPDRCAAACTAEIFAADEATEMAARGVPFREAYRRVSRRLPAGGRDARTALRARRSPGFPGNPLPAALLGRIARAERAAARA